jgi:hypothetical protein
MRTAIVNFIKTLDLGSYTFTDKLPWDDNGAPLYHHNRKHIYVDTDQTSQTALLDTLDQRGAVDETVSVNVYFVNDAKRLPADYESVVEQLKGARLASGSGYMQRTVQVTSTYIADDMLTKLEFSFRKIIT